MRRHPVLRKISGIDRLSLTGCEIGSAAAWPRFDLRQTEQPSDAHLDSSSFFFAAPGIKR